MSIEAYWISPSGKAIEVERLHIATIIQNPTKFNTTAAKLKKIYDKHKEQFSPFLEGFAREEIMSDMIQKGWIRTRFERRSNTWTIQLNKLSNRAKDYIFDWVVSLVKKGDMSKSTGIRIFPMTSPELLGDSGDVLDFSLFENNNISRPKCEYLVEFCTIEEFDPKFSDYL